VSRRGAPSPGRKLVGRVVGALPLQDPRVLSAVGAVCVLGSLLVTFLPGVLPLEAVEPFVAPFANELVVVLLGLTAGGLGAYWAWQSAGEDDDATHTGTVVAIPDYDAGTRDSVDTVADGIDGVLDDLASSSTALSDAQFRSTRSRVRRRFRDTVVDVLVASYGYERSEAVHQVDHGLWTDDVRAAHFLGNDTVAKPPLRIRITDWIRGEPFAAKVRASVDRLAALADVTGDEAGAELRSAIEDDDAARRLGPSTPSDAATVEHAVGEDVTAELAKLERELGDDAGAPADTGGDVAAADGDDAAVDPAASASTGGGAGADAEPGDRATETETVTAVEGDGGRGPQPSATDADGGDRR
jgi:hypothetical protein